jgi:hypothetical protein
MGDLAGGAPGGLNSRTGRYEKAPGRDRGLSVAEAGGAQTWIERLLITRMAKIESAQQATM